MIRLGLCCVFLEAPIHFRTTTAAACSRLSKRQAQEKLGGLCLENATALEKAIAYCADHGIGAFRIGSGFFPLKTHPVFGYRLDDVPNADAVATWTREPVFHLSSPRDGWRGAQPRRHSTMIRIADFPREWEGLKVTVEVEAKAKEKAVARLRSALSRRGIGVSVPRGCPAPRE